MFYCTTDGQYINEGQAFTIGDTQYPANWLNLSTPEEKAEIGLEEVIAINQPFNPIYYWTGETLEQATLTYTGTPKDLLDVQGNAVTQVNQSAYTLLFPTDWMVVRAIETSTTVAPDWNAWRESIRQYAADKTIAIKATTNVNEVETVMNNLSWPLDPDQVIAKAAQEVTSEPV